MAELGLQVLDHTIHDTNVWLKEISEEMERPDRQMAYHALRAMWPGVIRAFWPTEETATA